SVCVHCGLGCNTIPGERYGMLRRIRNRFNGAVNGYFLCDRGRYGYGFVNSGRRIRQSLLRRNRSAPAQPVTKPEALQHLAALLSSGGSAIGIGSPRASIEANFALRALVGPERFYTGMPERDGRLLASMLNILRQGPARSPSLHEVELADAVLVLGEDVTNTAPLLALALRQSVRRQPGKIAEKMHIPYWNDHAVREAIQQERGPLFVATSASTKLDDVATQTFRGAPDDLARLGFAMAHALDSGAPYVPDLPDATRMLARTVAEALKAAEHPLVISGMGGGDDAVIEAAANVAWSLCNTGRPAELCFAVPECNSLGVAMLGGASLESAFKAVRSADTAIAAADAGTVIILENDLYQRSDAAAVDRFLAAAKHVVVIDHITHATSEKADIVLPAGTFAEADGTFVNNEGRAQRSFQVFAPQCDIQESWRWVRDIMTAVGRDKEVPWSSLDHVTTACATVIPELEPILRAAPTADFRINGQKIPREPHRYSGRTAMLANISVHEPEPPEDADSPLAFSNEGFLGHPPSALIARFWAPGWNSVQAVNKFQDEVGGSLTGGDPGVRLIEPALPVEPGKVDYFGNVPEAFERRTGEWLVVPLHHIFGTEETSALAPGIADLVTGPYLALHPDDAMELGLAAGDDLQVQLELGGGGRTGYRLPVKLRAELKRGVAGLPAGLPGLTGIALPGWGKVTKTDEGKTKERAPP
ncbi:MAG: molybdopterin-dependent oxidoreductase, partial [Nitrosospira sp.]